MKRFNTNNPVTAAVTQMHCFDNSPFVCLSTIFYNYSKDHNASIALADKIDKAVANVYMCHTAAVEFT